METWGNGAGGLIPAECTSTDSVYSNIDYKFYNVDYKYTKDHSKYGITVNSTKNMVFFGDINRM